MSQLGTINSRINFKLFWSSVRDQPGKVFRQGQWGRRGNVWVYDEGGWQSPGKGRGKSKSNRGRGRR